MKQTPTRLTRQWNIASIIEFERCIYFLCSCVGSLGLSTNPTMEGFPVLPDGQFSASSQQTGYEAFNARLDYFSACKACLFYSSLKYFLFQLVRNHPPIFLMVVFAIFVSFFCLLYNQWCKQGRLRASAQSRYPSHLEHLTAKFKCLNVFCT